MTWITCPICHTMPCSCVVTKDSPTFQSTFTTTSYPMEIKPMVLIRISRRDVDAEVEVPLDEVEKTLEVLRKALDAG